MDSPLGPSLPAEAEETSVSDGVWRGYEKPGGAHFSAPLSKRYLLDCPCCRYGTLEDKKNDSAKMACIDCGQEFTKEQLRKLGVLKKPPTEPPEQAA